MTTLKKEAESQRDLEKAQSEAIAPTTTTRVLSYAKASDLAGTLKKFLSARGDIIADDRSNQLIIRDIPSVIPDHRQSYPATGPQVAAGGDRSARDFRIALLCPGHRHGTWFCGDDTKRNRNIFVERRKSALARVRSTLRRRRR